MNFPIPSQIVERVIVQNKAFNLDSISIRGLVSLASGIESASGIEFIHMELGSPGLPSPQIGLDAEKNALDSGCTSIYPSIDGVPQLKTAASEFIKAFLNSTVPARCCVPTVGSMQGVLASFIATVTRDPQKDTVLFLDPGFAVQKQQLAVLGYKFVSVDIADHRGPEFRTFLRQMVQTNAISSVVYSNPNNPTWMCFTDNELEIIGDLATEFDFVVIEDLAYLCMDFRNDLSVPYNPPYQPTIARYTDNYILHISASKIFSYAGQRIAIAAISEKLFDREFANFEKRFAHSQFGMTYIYSVLYSLSAGVTHSVQFGLAAMFRAATIAQLDFVNQTRQYGARAIRLKEIFTKHGFLIAYPLDGDKEVADGFFFTISYPNMTGAELLKNLLHYGISAITLKATGANRCGLRACTSAIKPHHFEILNDRLSLFVKNHPIKP